MSDLHPVSDPLGDGWTAFAAAAEAFESAGGADQWFPVPAPAAAASAGPRRWAPAAAVVRRRVGLLALAPVLALPLVGLATAGAGGPGSVAPVARTRVLAVSPLTLLSGASPASPSASAAASAPAAPSAAASAAAPVGHPAAGGRSPGTGSVHSSGHRSYAPWHRSTAAHHRPARSGAGAPAAPWSPAVPLPGGGFGGLCQAAEQAGGLHGQQLDMCRSVYGS